MSVYDEISDIFKRIAKPHELNAVNPSQKATAIIKELEVRNLNYIYDRDIGVIVGNPETDYIILMSHYDLIPLFNKCFENNKYNLLDTQIYRQAQGEEAEIVIGALDNTILNAIVIHNAKKLKDLGVCIVFDDGEETCSHETMGAFKLFKKYDIPEQKLILNTDVTNDNVEYYMSIEADKISKDNYYLLRNLIPNGSNIQPHRMFDSLNAVAEYKYHGISLCLPTFGNMHSLESITTKDRIEEFSDNLINIIDLINKNINKTSLKQSMPVDFFKKYRM